MVVLFNLIQNYRKHILTLERDGITLTRQLPAWAMDENLEEEQALEEAQRRLRTVTRRQKVIQILMVELQENRYTPEWAADDEGIQDATLDALAERLLDGESDEPNQEALDAWRAELAWENSPENYERQLERIEERLRALDEVDGVAIATDSSNGDNSNDSTVADDDNTDSDDTDDSDSIDNNAGSDNEGENSSNADNNENNQAINNESSTVDVNARRVRLQRIKKYYQKKIEDSKKPAYVQKFERVWLRTHILYLRAQLFLFRVLGVLSFPIMVLYETTRFFLKVINYFFQILLCFMCGQLIKKCWVGYKTGWMDKDWENLGILLLNAGIIYLLMKF